MNNQYNNFIFLICNKIYKYLDIIDKYNIFICNKTLFKNIDAKKFYIKFKIIINNKNKINIILNPKEDWYNNIEKNIYYIPKYDFEYFYIYSLSCIKINKENNIEKLYNINIESKNNKNIQLIKIYQTINKCYYIKNKYNLSCIYFDNKIKSKIFNYNIRYYRNLYINKIILCNFNNKNYIFIYSIYLCSYLNIINHIFCNKVYNKIFNYKNNFNKIYKFKYNKNTKFYILLNNKQNALNIRINNTYKKISIKSNKNHVYKY